MRCELKDDFRGFNTNISKFIYVVLMQSYHWCGSVGLMPGVLFKIHCCVSVLSSSTLSLWSPASHPSSSLTDQAQHRPSSPCRSPSPLPPVRLGLPRCNHGGDEDEVPFWKKGEAGPGTVAPLMVCHSCRGHDLHPGVPPQDRTPQESRGNWSFKSYSFFSVGH